jgi:pimeloyl-ACP methyl ester carboxylesterase
LGPLPSGTVRRSHIPDRLLVPVTAILRLDGARQEILAGRIEGRLEVYAKDAAPTIHLGNVDVPLEYEPSGALGLTLDKVPVASIELLGFLGRQAQRFKISGREGDLVTLTPYVPGKFPVVLVHGTASSPVRWAELLNEMDADPRIARRFQFWLFTYDTGNPIAYSGALLRQALEDALHEFDSEGRDPDLRRMVVIGHSQGGLLTKLTAIDSADRFWANVSKRNLEDFDVKPETRELLRRSFFFHRMPAVARVIFMATPHRGSHLATERIAGLVRRLVSLPRNLLGVIGDVAQAAAATDPELARLLREQTPRSVDNMSPTNAFIRTLSAIPVDRHVRAHSIIAVEGSGPVEQQNDGVVPYASAHIDEAVSEKIVRSGHSVQGHPEAIEEVRRILLEHAGL